MEVPQGRQRRMVQNKEFGLSDTHIATSSQNAFGLLRRGLLLEYATLAWNVVGTVIVAAAAIRASSVALAGFGLDLLIEIFASVIVVWQLNGINQARERTALRLIAVAFVALSAYVLAQFAFTMLTGLRPTPSAVGIVWLVVTVAAMLALARGKYKTGRQLGNQVLMSSSASPWWTHILQRPCLSASR